MKIESENVVWPRCTMCGSEYPHGLISYMIQIRPAVKGWNVKANENPVRKTKAGVCKKCAEHVARLLDGKHNEERGHPE